MRLGDIIAGALFVAVAVVFGVVFLRLTDDEDDGEAESMCLRACGPRRGVAVEGACYCENEGEDLIPIEQLIPDTGCRKTEQP